MGKGFDLFMRNPYWRRIYEEAPTERLKEYWRLTFEVDGSNFRNPRRERQLDKVDAALTIEELRYLLEVSGNGHERWMLRKRIERMEREAEGPGTANDEKELPGGVSGENGAGALTPAHRSVS